jgi:hypothetical protein
MICKRRIDMIFWVFVILIVVGILMYIVSDKIYSDVLEFCGLFTAFVSFITVVVMLVIIICEGACAPSLVAENQERYKALTYKLESGACRDEFGLLNKAVIDEVQEWNEEVVYYQVAQDNFWIGIFYPNVFDQFETIDYTKYNLNDGGN